MTARRTYVSRSLLRRSQAPAQIYNNLSPNALHLVDLLLKPQHLRPTIDTILKHPWLSPQHPGNVVSTAQPTKSSLSCTSNMKVVRGKMVVHEDRTANKLII